MHVFDSGWIGSGAGIIGELEEQFCSLLGVQHTQLVSNGSVALMLALRALGVGSGDEVIVPALTYAATASSVVNVGAEPVFCDVSLNSWQINLDTIQLALSSKTKAVIVPHLYGMAANIRPIVEFCHALGIFVVEDAAEALGALFEGQHVGTFADIGTYSFFPNKLITSGEGGLCATNSAELDSRMRLLKSQGMSANLRYVFEEPGYNFRITGIQGAVLQAQVQRFDELKKARSDSEQAWRDSLKDILEPEADYDHVRAPWIFSFRMVGTTLESKRLFAEKLASQGIETRPVFYPLPLLPGFSKFRSLGADNASSISDESISIPTGKHVPVEVYDLVSDILSKHLKEVR